MPRRKTSQVPPPRPSTYLRASGPASRVPPRCAAEGSGRRTDPSDRACLRACGFRSLLRNPLLPLLRTLLTRGGMGAGRQVHGAVQRATPRIQQVEHRDEAVRVLERCRNLEAVLWMQLGMSASLDVGTALVAHLADTWGVAGAVRAPLPVLGSIVPSTHSEHTSLLG